MCQLCLEAAARAQALGGTVPKAELEELRELLEAPEDQPLTPPDSSRIGYFRHVMSRPVSGAWTVDVPGYYFFEAQDEGATTVYGYNDRTIHCSSLDFEGPDASLEEMMEQEPDGDEEGELVEHKAEHLLGRARICGCVDDDGCPGFLLQGRMLTRGSMAIVTITYSDAADHDWARATFCSLAHPGPTHPQP